jgi:serine/threonine protein kinase
MQNYDTAPVKDGDVLAGKYRVDRLLGVGGMGVVVLATHLQLEQKVALKFLLPWALANQQAVERFTREARAAVRLKSDHVARVLDVGTLETGSPYIVMEFLEGIDLGDLIQRPGHKIRIDEAVDFVLQACDAVAEAHALGIVHRDLKPRNLFLTTGNDGNALIKVLDFGISKSSGHGGDLSLTRTTEIVGSPNYMSPEQLRASRDVDSRTDIWALGVILYELLGGTVPFVAETLTQLTALVITEPPRPLHEIRPDVPPGLVEVISRCLEKDPTRRLPSVADLAMALDPYAPEHSRGLAQRVRRVADRQKGAAASPSSLSPSTDQKGGMSPPLAAKTPGAGTSVSWGKTELAEQPGVAPAAPSGASPGWKIPAVIFGGVFAAGLVVAMLFVAMRSRSPSVASAGGDSPGAAAAGLATAGGGPPGPPPASGGQANAPRAESTSAPAPPATGAAPPTSPDPTGGGAAPASTMLQPTTKPVAGRSRTSKPLGAKDAAAPPASTDDMPSDRH